MTVAAMESSSPINSAGRPRNQAVLGRGIPEREESAGREHELHPEFAAILQTLSRISARPEKSLSDDSAFLMFEPPMESPLARREEVMREDHRNATPSLTQIDRLDRTSVQARLSTGESSLNDHASPMPADQDFAIDRPSTMEHRSENGTVRESVRSLDTPAARQLQGLTSSRSSSATAQAGQQVLTSASPSAVQSSSTFAPPIAAGMPAGLVSNASGRSAAPTPAEQVASVLATGKGLTTESSRFPATPPPTTGESKPSAPETRNPAQPGAAREGSVGRPGDSPVASSVDRSAFEEMIRSMRLRTGEHRSSAKIHLQPPRLGRVMVDLQLTGQSLRLSVRTETAEARTLIGERADRLRAALEQHGIHVERFDVTGDSTKAKEPAVTAGEGQRLRDGGDRRGHEQRNKRQREGVHRAAAAEPQLRFEA